MTSLITRVMIGSAIVLSLIGCGLFKPKESSSGQPDLKILSQSPLSPDESQALLDEMGKNFVYGEGMGCSMLSLGTIAVFPPYAALLIGNAALSLNGYEELWPSDLLPEEDRKNWSSTYSELCSVPGRISADLAGEEFRSEEHARQRLEKFLRDRQSKDNQARSAQEEPEAALGPRARGG